MHRSLPCAVVFLLGLASTALGQSSVVEQDLMIPVRDGIRLSTKLYRPAMNGVPVTERLPALLQRTPYDLATSEKQAEYFARHGYVVVLQNIRGRYLSEGKFLKVQPADATDGYDVIE